MAELNDKLMRSIGLNALPAPNTSAESRENEPKSTEWTGFTFLFIEIDHLQNT
jgi:hypothetical protein